MFSPLNTLVFAVYLLVMLGIGLCLVRRQKTTQDFFLAGRRVPWLVVAMSMYASLTSAVTFMAVPGMAGSKNISLIAVCVVSPLVAPFLVRLFYPFYHRLGVTTSYEYIGRRFGSAARMAVSLLFVLNGLGWLGTVIFAPALALSNVSNLDLELCILLMGGIATGYTALGGMAADIWTDMVQFVIMIVGIAWMVFALTGDVAGGVGGIMGAAQIGGRLDVGGFGFNLGQMTLWAVGVSFFFQLMQQYGTDQTTVQRMMATPSLGGIRKAIYFNAVTDFVVMGLLLFAGLGLYAYSTGTPNAFPESIKPDAWVPYYIVKALPDGISGLVITALLAAAMSSMDSGIGCVSTVIVNDLVRPWRPMDDRRHLILAKTLTVLVGGFATLLAFQGKRFESLVDQYTTYLSLFSAPVLALFLLGVLSRHASFVGWLVGLAVSIPATLWLQQVVKANWIYHFPFSFAVCFVVGYGVSVLVRYRGSTVGLTLWEKT